MRAFVPINLKSQNLQQLHDVNIDLESEGVWTDLLEKQAPMLQGRIYLDYCSFDRFSGTKYFFSKLEKIENIRSLTIKSTQGVSFESLTHYIQNTVSLRELRLANSSVEDMFTHLPVTPLEISSKLASAIKHNHSLRYISLVGMTDLLLDQEWINLLHSNPFISLDFDMDKTNTIHTQLKQQSDQNKMLQGFKRTNPCIFRKKCMGRFETINRAGIEPCSQLLQMVNTVPSLQVIAAETLIDSMRNGITDTNDLTFLPYPTLFTLIELSPFEDHPYDYEYFIKNPENVLIDYTSNHYQLASKTIHQDIDNRWAGLLTFVTHYSEATPLLLLGLAIATLGITTIEQPIASKAALVTTSLLMASALAFFTRKPKTIEKLQPSMQGNRDSGRTHLCPC